MSTCNNKKIRDSGNWVTQTEAARLRKVSPTAIFLLLKRKRLRCKVVSGRRLVHREDVLNFKSLTDRGRPTKNVTAAASAEVDREEWITQKEAAKLRQLTVSGIQTAITRGRIRVLKRKGIPFVCKRDVLNYQPRIDFNPESPSQSILPPGANPEDWITVAEAARIRGVNQSIITTHATRKRVRSIRKGRTRLIYREDIINFKRKPRTVRPKKK